MAHVYAACPVHATILVMAVNSNRFQIFRVAHSYSSHPFLCALGTLIVHVYQLFSFVCTGDVTQRIQKDIKASLPQKHI